MSYYFNLRFFVTFTRLDIFYCSVDYRVDNIFNAGRKFLPHYYYRVSKQEKGTGVHECE